MKITLYIILIATLLLRTTHSLAQKDQGMDQIEVQVDGLGCPFCAYGLEKKFKEFKGIKDVAINIETGDFSFRYPTTKALTLEVILQQVTKAGYTPNQATITRANGAVETNKGRKKEKIEATASEQLIVHGKCGMCKARIENAMLQLDGVESALWIQNKELLTVEYDPSLVTLSAFYKASVAIGHDTEKLQTSEEAYNSLPACCHYKRAR